MAVVCVLEKIYALIGEPFEYRMVSSEMLKHA